MVTSLKILVANTQFSVTLPPAGCISDPVTSCCNISHFYMYVYVVQETKVSQ